MLLRRLQKILFGLACLSWLAWFAATVLYIPYILFYAPRTPSNPNNPDSEPVPDDPYGTGKISATMIQFALAADRNVFILLLPI